MRAAAWHRFDDFDNLDHQPMSESAVNPYQPPASATVADDVAEPDVTDLAGRGARLGAVLLDALLLNSAFWYLVDQLQGGTGLTEPRAFVPAAIVLVVAGVQVRLLYERGQTLGKLALGIRIVRRNGAPAGLPRILLLREAFAGLAPHVPVIGTLVTLVDSLMIFRADHRCLHDHVADTIVVRARKPRAEPLPPYLVWLETAPR